MDNCEYNKNCENEGTWLAEITDKCAGFDNDCILICDSHKEQVEKTVGNFSKAEFERV